MICVSIGGKTLEEISSVLERDDVEMAEIRLDLCRLSKQDIETLFSSSDKPLVATCRVSGKMSPEKAETMLMGAVEAGAAFADLELQMPAQMSKRLCHVCRECGTTIIRSWHDQEKTPSAEELSEILSKARRFGADIVKIAVFAREEDDFSRLSDLYASAPKGKLLAFCMGEKGRDSRLDALRFGAPFTYACLSEEEKTAPGQWTIGEMNRALYGDRKFYRKTFDNLPASKSLAQRAIIASALSEGTSVLRGYTPCADSEAAVAVAERLGAKVERGRNLKITGIGPAPDASQVDEICAGESGLLARLLIPLMAGIGGGKTRITGEKTLLKRPLSGANDIMAAFGVMLSSIDSSEKKDVRVPLEVSGKLLPGKADVSGRGGSQLISGLLMALPLLGKNSTLYVHDPRSIPYMFITMDLLRKFGVKMVNEMEGDDEFLETRDWKYCTAMNFRIPGSQKYVAADIELEKDWSAAAMLMVAGALFGSVRLKGMDMESLQADLSITDILVEAGASVSQDEDGTVNVFKAPLAAFKTDLNNAPDLFPAVALLAAFCPGESRIEGIGRLVNKESDRGEAICTMLSKMGVEAFREGDELVVEGESLSSRLLSARLLKGGSYSSFNDHRMAMVLKIAEIGADSPIVTDNTACVEKSFPAFMNIL